MWPFWAESRFGLAESHHWHLGNPPSLISIFLLRHRLSDRQAALCSLYPGLRDAVPAIPVPGWDFVPWGSGLSARSTADISAVSVSSLVTEAICTNSAFSTPVLVCAPTAFWRLLLLVRGRPRLHFCL